LIILYNIIKISSRFSRSKMKNIYDVAVIGGGVIGGTILRELSKYQLNCVLLEKGSDVSLGQSRANSGIVHAGFDAKEGTLKA
jgi:glycerol-3-phosphate dehydrogenase